MGKRDRARRDGSRGETLLPRPPAPAAPPSPVERVWRVLLAVTRNAVGLVGTLFLGWAAPTLVVLYFADTLAGMWAVFAAVGFKLSHADPRRGLAAVLGAVAGMLAAPSVFLDPNLMAALLIYAFAAAVLGGIDSPIGAVVGGLTLGVGLNLIGTYVDFVGADLRLPVALLVILVVLLVKPTGIFGKEEVRRV